MGAVEGMHDDRLMTRAIGVWVCYHIDPPRRLRKETVKKPGGIVSEATL